MQIILASTNQGKIKEIENLLPQFQVIPYSNILGKFNIVENGKSFKENAIIKTKTIIEKLNIINYNKDDYIVISDDSGITVPALNNEPNIFSARYAGGNATDKQNNDKLIKKLKTIGVSKTKAYYTACIAIGYKDNIFTTHGWMHGNVIDRELGLGGFGYDPLFIPNGYTETLGTLNKQIKKELSHRAKAIELAMLIIKNRI